MARLSRKWKPGKLGTVPALLWIHEVDRRQMKPGDQVRYRNHPAAQDYEQKYWHGKWSIGRVTRINPDGYVFLDQE